MSTNTDISTALSVTTPPQVNTRPSSQCGGPDRADRRDRCARARGDHCVGSVAVDREHLARTPAEAFTNPPQWIPLHPDFSNYSAVFDQIPIGRFFINSVIVTVLIVVDRPSPAHCQVTRSPWSNSQAATRSSRSSSPP